MKSVCGVSTNIRNRRKKTDVGGWYREVGDGAAPGSDGGAYVMRKRRSVCEKCLRREYEYRRKTDVVVGWYREIGDGAEAGRKVMEACYVGNEASV